MQTCANFLSTPRILLTLLANDNRLCEGDGRMGEFKVLFLFVNDEMACDDGLGLIRREVGGVAVAGSLRVPLDVVRPLFRGSV